MKDETLASPKDAALKLALEALEYRGGSTWLKHGIAVEAIKAALAQGETSSPRAAQEPVVWPFPPATGAIPWTKQQEKAYEQQKQEQQEAAPF